MSGKQRTTRHLDVLDAIRQFKDRRGYSPSMRDLMEMTGIASLSSVKYYLDILERDGVIRRSAKVARSIEIGSFSANPQSQKIPLRIKADAKKSAAGAKGKGVNAFTPRKTKRTDALQKRIDMVIEQALAKDEGGAGYDVVQHDPRRLRFSRAHKVG